MHLAFCSLLIACCVTPLYVQIITEQSVQECDATMLNLYAIARFIKFLLYQRFALIILFSNSLQDWLLLLLLPER